MKRRIQSVNPTRDRRRGAVMVFGLIVLMVASSIIAILLRTASVSHRQFKREEYRAQASLLADAGIARALSKLSAQPEFTEEVWNLPAEQLSPGRTAVVRLKIVPDSENQDRRIVSVVTEFPSSHPDVVRLSREMSISKSN